MQTDPEEDYARGWVPFLDCAICLDSRPLIPRVETEYWVERAIVETEKLKGEQKEMRCLDLCAGSGAIGIALLRHLPNAHVDFGEIDVAHLPTILKSIRENKIDEKRAHIVETDIWSTVAGAYDAIFANPPYLSRNRREKVQNSVIASEPEMALFAAEDGFALIRRIIEGVREHLLPGGTLFLEHEPEQSGLIGALASQKGLRAETHNDQFGLARWSVISVA